MRGVQGAAERAVALARAHLLEQAPGSRLHDVSQDPRFQHRGVDLLWEREGHPDHHALHTIVTAAFDRARWHGLALGYEVWNAMVPDVIVDITAVVEQKKNAMLAHQSQLAYTRYDHCMLGLAAYRSMVHLGGRGYGEAFRIVRSPRS